MGQALLAACLAVVLAGPGRAGPAPHRVDMKNIAFMPPRLTIRAGDSVVWHNGDIVAHTASSQQGGLDVVVAPGAEQTATFSRAGTVNYICRYHPNMRGEIVVQP
jgi:plastocyanin